MKRNPHPARRSRIATLGISATAFVSVVTSLAWNTHQAELAANTTDLNVVPVENVAPVSNVTTPVVPAASNATPAPSQKAKISPTASATSTVAPATPVTSSTPTSVTVAPIAPAPTVVYTCMSPGGKTENPTASGKCKNAQYGYVLTQI
jgi:hypothetical protein